MPHSEGWAKRLLRELRDPDTVLSRARTYADAVFLQLFFAWLDERIYRDPRSALKWARIAPDLARLTPEDAGPEGRQAHRSRQVKAWIILASAYRAVSEHGAADRSYAEALKLISSGTVSPPIKADTRRRLSYLRACQGRNEEALELATEAVESLRDLDNGRALARALIAQGYALFGLRRFGEALVCFCDALVAAGKPDKRAAEDLRLHSSICHNLAVTVSVARPSDQSLALTYIRQARELVKGGRRFVPRYRLLWVEGLVWSALGYHARAETVYRIAREGFEALRMPFEIALVSLDLGAVYAEHQEWDKLIPLAAEIFKRFRILAADTKAIAALSLWADAVKAQKLTDEITTSARQKIEARIGPGGCCKHRERSTVSRVRFPGSAYRSPNRPARAGGECAQYWSRRRFASDARSGFADSAALVSELAKTVRRPLAADEQVLRVELRYAGPDDEPSPALDDTLSKATTPSCPPGSNGPTSAGTVSDTLELIEWYPQTAASRLARRLGRETRPQAQEDRADFAR